MPDFRLRETAAIVAARGFGPAIAEETVGTINLAMLAVLSNASPPTWLCRPSASRVIHETDVHAIPAIPPPMLRKPGIVEARRPETGERLWGDIASLGWYSIDDRYWLIGLRYPDGYMVARWTPKWTGEDIDAQLPPLDPSALVPDGMRAEYYDFAHQAALYLVTLGLLAEVTDSPLRIVLDPRETRERKRKIINVFFDGDDGDEGSKKSPAGPRTPPLGGPILVGTTIRGHLKRQRFGAGNSRVRWIYVHGFQARRWMSPRWLVSEAGSGEM